MSACFLTALGFARCRTAQPALHWAVVSVAHKAPPLRCVQASEARQALAGQLADAEERLAAALNDATFAATTVAALNASTADLQEQLAALQQECAAK